MKKILSTAFLTTAWAMSLAQQPAIELVSVSAKGDDVRTVLHTLFTQTKKNYVLDPGVRFVLYLSLNEVEFEEALQLVCKNASLKYDVQNGIYFISKAPAKPIAPDTKPKIEPKAEPKAETKPESKPEVKPKPVIKTGSQSAVPVKQEAILQRKITTRFTKVDIRELFADLGRQSSVTILVNANVPAYKLDAFLNQTSLKFALDNICKAAGLKYQVTDAKTISISKIGDPAKTGK